MNGSHWVWGCVYWGGGGVYYGCGWVVEFWTSGVVYMLILSKGMSAVCLTQFGKKSGLSEFWKNALHFDLSKLTNSPKLIMQPLTNVFINHATHILSSVYISNPVEHIKTKLMCRRQLFLSRICTVSSLMILIFMSHLVEDVIVIFFLIFLSPLLILESKSPSLYEI